MVCPGKDPDASPALSRFVSVVCPGKDAISSPSVSVSKVESPCSALLKTGSPVVFSTATAFKTVSSASL